MENHEFTPAPNNHMVKAILTMLFCCLPFGVVALVNATKVEGLWAQGQKQLAQKAADDANKWANVALICGLVWVLIYVIYIVVVGAFIFA